MKYLFTYLITGIFSTYVVKKWLDQQKDLKPTNKQLREWKKNKLI